MYKPWQLLYFYKKSWLPRWDQNNPQVCHSKVVKKAPKTSIYLIKVSPSLFPVLSFKSLSVVENPYGHINHFECEGLGPD